jgi:MraZ protein
VFLVGTFELTIDAKNRLSVPFAVRRKLDPEQDGHSLYVLPGQRRGTIVMYPEKYFERTRPFVPEETLTDETHDWKQFESSQTALIDPDGQGRVLIPERLLKRAGVGRDVVLTGAQDHLLLWNRQDFEEFENGQWARFPESRAKAMQELRTLAATRPPTEPAR